MDNECFAGWLSRIDGLIEASLPDCSGPLSPVKEMLRYSLEGGGKRVRPMLCLMFCEACGASPEKALYFAAAVEYVHTYSLIHDDLPCMDNDDFRRGKPSSHKRFGEANALLAGDALLTHAFSLIARAYAEGACSAEQCVAAVRTLSERAGADGMVGGQYIDLACEGTGATNELLIEMDRLKTAALISAACETGCIAANAEKEKLAAARRFAEGVGLAFQITDDILEFNDENNSDVVNGKATYVSLYGMEKAKKLAFDYTQSALAALAVFGEQGEALRLFAEALLIRNK